MFPQRAANLFLALLAIFALVRETPAARSEEDLIAGDAMRLLSAQCISCHNAEKRKGGLELTSREKLLMGADSGKIIDASNPSESLIVKVLAADADPHMPPRKQLTAHQIDVVKKWVAAGAPWDTGALARASAPREVKLEQPPPGYQPTFALALSPDASRLAFGRANELLVYDLSATGFPIVAKITAHADVVRSVAWSKNGKLLASGGYKEVKLWRIPQNEEETVSESTDGLNLIQTFTASLNGQVTALRFTPYGGALLIADSIPGGAGWLRVIGVSEDKRGVELSAWQAHDDSLHAVDLSSDGGFVATGSADKTVKLWELVSGREIGRIEAHSEAVLGLAFNTNATEILTVSSDHHLKLWNVEDRHSIVSIGPRNYGFSATAWSADGKTAVAVTDDGRVIRFANFKAHTGAQSSETAEERSLRSVDKALHCVAVSANGERIAAGAGDGTVYLLNRDGKVQHTFEATSKVLAKTDSPSFLRDVLPMMAKAGCMAGTCHAKSEGQNGFRLTVFSFDPKSDFKEITSEAQGRRVFPVAPEESLLLLKPTAAVEHGGGQRFEPGSETYETILQWIRGGMAYQHENEPTLARVEIHPKNGRYKNGDSLRLKLTAHYSDGSERDVTHLADFVSNDKEIATVTDDAGAVTVGTLEGEGVIVGRYMGFVDASRVTIPAAKSIPAEHFAALPVNNQIDRIGYEQFRTLGLLPSELCTDSEFIRRSTLDAIGMLPTAQQVREFLADNDSGKRKKWIEHLLQHPAYADNWANKWTDLLRPNPDRVGVKSIFFLDQWIRQSFRENRPYDEFVREILLAEGSNHQEGPGTIYRDRREPQDRTTLMSQLFLGVRMECAKCHHHPTEKWSQDDFYQFAAFFGPVKQKGAGLSPPISAGRESFYFAEGGAVKHPVTDVVMKPRPLDSPGFSSPEKEDPRRALADWMTQADNPYFARAAVNRIWASFFGKGFVDPVDDFRISNPISQEPLLNMLAEDFVRHGYDLKHVMRTIMNSRLYQLSSIPNEYNLTDTKNFSRSYRRRLPAEVLLDAVNDVTGTQDEFNGCPPGTRAIQTWSYKVRSHFMDAFGRPNPSTDCPCERDMRSSVVQSLHMMNSQALQTKLSHADGRVKQLAEGKASPEEIVAELYLAALSRFPTAEELYTATILFTEKDATRQSATEDVLWALLNSPEFVFNH